MYSKLVISPTKDNKYKILKMLQYKDIAVPQGYKTNGANIPRVFWSIVPPFKPKYLPAVVIHDYLCDLEMYVKADKYFEEVLIDIEDSIITRAMIRAVKLYHRFRYNVNIKNN